MLGEQRLCHVLVKRLNDLIPDVTQLASLVVAITRRSRVAASELLRARTCVWLVVSYFDWIHEHTDAPVAMLEFRWYTVTCGCGICGGSS
jgi:hypothetical protein